uniref:Uncharacterized protein n=1 Tax=Triticum urartu TaxID=4572 RepID=A0A8R7R7N2_TRIUA
MAVRANIFCLRKQLYSVCCKNVHAIYLVHCRHRNA